MPLFNAPTFKSVSPIDLIMARTKASDGAWVEQALAMGFKPDMALSKNTSWFIAAARHDQKRGATIALRLAEATVLPILRTSIEHDAVVALSELCHAIVGAVEHGNVAFLTAFAPIFNALPNIVRNMAPRSLAQTSGGLPLPLEQVVWNEVLGLERQSPGKHAWDWVSTLPWENPLLNVEGAWTDVWTVTDPVAKSYNDSSLTSQPLPRDVFLDRLAALIPAPLTALALDSAFVHGRLQMNKEADNRNHRSVKALDLIVGLLGRQLDQGAIVLSNGWSGQDLRANLLAWGESWPKGSPMHHDWTSTARRWEMALLRHAAQPDVGELPVAPPRARL